jgi:cobalt-zinc-cadmium resistance protein CzcA
MEIEFTQPIEMRFNELISGTRSDVAIKVFGEDLSVLAEKAEQIRQAIAHVEGAADIIVEKIDGLPQMTVDYKRTRIAQYGLNISDINDIVALSFAGTTVGNVFEGERRFDLVIRLEENLRNDIDDLRNLYVPLPDGGQIPLRELARVEYTEGLPRYRETTPNAVW